MLQPGDKKALTILGAVVVAALVVLAGTTALLLRGHEKPVPTVSLQAGDDLVRMESGFWCSAKMTDCTPADPRQVEVKTNIYRVPAPIGKKVMITVPGEIAAGPWTTVAEFATPVGLQRVLWLHAPDSLYTQVIESTPDRVLTAVEVSAFSGVQIDSPQGVESAEGSILMRGTFSANTKPDGFEIENTTQLPDVRG